MVSIARKNMSIESRIIVILVLMLGVTILSGCQSDDDSQLTDKERFLNKVMAEVGKQEGSRSEYTGKWCASFIMYCAKSAEVPEDIIPHSGYDYVPDFQQWALKNGRYVHVYKYPSPSSELLWDNDDESGPVNTTFIPSPGDLVITTGNGSPGTRGHMAVVTEVKNGEIHTIGGNQDDAVRSNRVHEIRGESVVGYIMTFETH